MSLVVAADAPAIAVCFQFAGAGLTDQSPEPLSLTLAAVVRCRHCECAVGRRTIGRLTDADVVEPWVGTLGWLTDVDVVKPSVGQGVLRRWTQR